MTYPTETSYALGGNALHAGLVEAIFRLKGRTEDKALPLLIAGAAQARELAEAIHPAAEALMAACWPGPLTLVLHAAPGLPAHVADARGTVALRHSPHESVAELLALGGAPLIGTSANRSGSPPACTAAQVLETFGDAVMLAVDGGEAGGGPPSTLLDTTALPFRILRHGAVAAEDLRRLLKRDFPQAAPE